MVEDRSHIEGGNRAEINPRDMVSLHIGQYEYVLSDKETKSDEKLFHEIANAINAGIEAEAKSGVLEILENEITPPLGDILEIPYRDNGKVSLRGGTYYAVSCALKSENEADIPAGMLIAPDSGMFETQGNYSVVSSSITYRSGERIDGFCLFDNDTGWKLTLGDVLATLSLIKHSENAKQPRRKRKGKYSSPTSMVKVPNDPLTLAIMGRNKGHIEPSEYFSSKGRNIDTGSGGTAKLTINAADDVEIDADERLYVLDNETHFWLSMLSSIAEDTGKTEIYGSDILKLADYKNPYKDESAEVMASAARNISKAMRTFIAIDTTEERRNKRRKNRETIESIGLRPYVRCDIDIVKEAITDDRGNATGEIVKDFVVSLKADGELIDAFPVYKYADDRDMILTIRKDELSFKGLKLHIDDRRMWFYVLSRVKSQKLSNTIKFDLMWKTLNLKPREYKAPAKIGDDGKELKDEEGNTIYEHENMKIIKRKQSEAMRKKRERMIKQLEKMLVQASGGLGSGEKMKRGAEPKYPRRIAGWEWTTDRSTGRVDGVKITPLKSTT